MMDKKHFDRKLSELIGHGFLFDLIWARWERVRAGKTERIGIGYNEYPGSYYIKGMGASLIFDEVENILQTVLSHYVTDQHYGDETIQKILFKMEGVDYTKLKQEIHDEASYESACIEMRKLVEEGAMPFFEKYQTLEDVADLLSEKKPEEVVPYISGAILFPKTILILKLAHHPSYPQKLIEFRNTLKEQVPKQNIYKQMLAVYDNLFAEDLKEFL